MHFKLKLLPIVHVDLRKAKKWYSDINIFLAEVFKSAVNAEIDDIQAYPEYF